MPRYSGGGSCTPATSPLAAVKLEPDLSLDLKPDLEAMDQCPGIKVEAELELDNLQNLISTCDFSSVLEEDVLTATRGWSADQDHQPWKQEPAEPLRWKEEECQPHRRRQDPLNSIRWKEEIPEWKEEPLDPSGWKEGAGLASSLKAEEESTPSPLDRGISLVRAPLAFWSYVLTNGATAANDDSAANADSAANDDSHAPSSPTATNVLQHGLQTTNVPTNVYIICILTLI